MLLPLALLACHTPEADAPHPRPPLTSDSDAPTDSAAPGADTDAGEDTTRPPREEEEPEDLTPEVPPRNVLMVSIDTLRRDRVGRYDGSDRTPFLDSLLAAGVAMDNHRSCSNWTWPSLNCTLSGLYDTDSGFAAGETDPEDPGALPPAPDDVAMLPDLLRERGFVTALTGTSPFLTDGYRISDRYDYTYAKGNLLAEQVIAAALTLQESLAADGRPWLHHIHVTDPHQPYDPPDEYVNDALAELQELPWDLRTTEGLQEMMDQWVAQPGHIQAEILATLRVLYNGEVAYLDDQLEILFSGLEAIGALEDTLVVLWSDHGEQFYDHGGIQHRADLYGEETFALGALLGPGVSPRAWTKPTSHVDLVPSTLAFLGLEPPEETSGVVVGRAPSTRPRFLSSIKDDFTRQAIDLGSERLIYTWSGNLELYNLAVDPEERRDLSDVSPDRVRSLWAKLSPEVAALAELYTLYSPVDPGLDESE
jgi:arylsulfatase A-like enzyme